MLSIDLSEFIPQHIFDFNFKDNIPKLKRKFWINKINNKKYMVVNYDKKYINESKKNINDNLGLLRSVVLNDKSEILAFSPPSSYNLNGDNCRNVDKFIKQDNFPFPLSVQEFIDGTMINLFWDGDNWEISTNKCVSGNIGFYIHNNSKTFRDMFFDICKEINLDLDMLSKTINGNRLSYSFVIQHKDNRIVTPISENALFLINIYEISQTEKGIHIYPHYPQAKSFPEFYKNILPQTNIKLPKNYQTINSVKELNDVIKFNTTTLYSIKGIILNDLCDFTRYKIRNNNYDYVSVLKGNQPKSQYRFLELNKQHKLLEYYKYFPEDIHIFATFSKQLNNTIKRLYNLYVECHIKHTIAHIYCPYEYKPHIYHLHGIYLKNKQKIIYETVKNYFNNLPTQMQLYIINYNKRVLVSPN